jgi:VWFA-related protein
MMSLRPLIYFILLTIGSSAVIAQNLSFRVDTEEVQIDVFATSKGKPVEGLQSSDFEVFDNGVKQTVQYAKLQQELPINTLLVFDMSWSVEGNVLTDLKEAAHTFLSCLRKEDQAGLITFNQAITLGSPLTHDFKSIEQALNRTQPMGNSSLYDASYAGLAVPKSSPNPVLIIIFSDGFDTDSWLTETEALESARNNDAVVYSITTLPPSRFSNSTKPNFYLDELTKATGGSLYFIESSSALSDTFIKILEDFRRHYLVAYTPQGVSENGWHTLEVRLRNHNLKVKTRPGYLQRKQ